MLICPTGVNNNYIIVMENKIKENNNKKQRFIIRMEGRTLSMGYYFCHFQRRNLIILPNRVRQIWKQTTIQF